MSHAHRVVALGAALWLLTMSNVLAADKSSAKAPEIRTGHAAVEKALAEPVRLDFAETPLSDVLDNLKGQCKIEIVLDTRALNDVGITAATLVTVDLHPLALRSALNLMLRPLNLKWTIQDDVLLITTPEEEESKLITKVYDVADLVVCRDCKGKDWDDYDSLIDMLTSTVMPTTWDDVGGSGSIAPANFGSAKAIVLSHSYQAHREIAQLLAEIRVIARKTPNAGPPQRDKPVPKPKAP
jgi:hypothetical protein